MTWRRLSALIAAVGLAASCGSTESNPRPAAERTVASTSTVAQLAVGDLSGSEVELSPTTTVAAETGVVDHGDLDPEAVVVAAVLIASGGDLEAAIAEGWITEAEAEAALKGIEDGSLAALLD